MHFTYIASDRFTHAEIYMCNIFINTVYNLEFLICIYDFMWSSFINIIQVFF